MVQASQRAIKTLAAGGDRLEFNVTRCRHAELFQELGLPELGALFHCSRDFAMARFSRKSG